VKKDFIHIQDFEASELDTLIRLIEVVKEAVKMKALPSLLQKESVAMIFEEASTRTRTAFEVAATLLGGHALYMRPDEIHLGKSESLYDTAKVLGRMVQGIVIRATKYRDIADLASYADVPVINAMADDTNHPTQVLSDVFTMYETTGKIKGLNLAFIGVSRKGESASNVCRDLMLISSIMGINCTVASPEDYRVDEDFLNQTMDCGKISGAKIRVTDDPIDAVSHSDFVYTDEFAWYDTSKEEKERRKKAFIPKYQVNDKLMKHARAGAKFMHCLPARRNEEVTDEIIDGARSIVFNQSENKLYTNVALLAALISPRALSVQKKQEKYRSKIQHLLTKLHAVG
jgi:putrescine carbamoyltransferase